MRERKLILLFAFAAWAAMVVPSARAGAARLGEFGFELDFLQRHYTSPQEPGESNFFIDLWAEQSLSSFARECRLTNNHTLFVNSHGGGVAGRRGTQYAYMPHRSILKPSEKTPCYSAADLAAILGPVNAAQIHNILISGCNAEGAFKASELRKYFVNATNVVHMLAGNYGYQPMFRQILTSPSCKIQPMYETGVKNDKGRMEYFMGTNPKSNSTRLSPYVAELFQPDQTVPFSTGLAGRELLAPEHPSLLAP